MAKGTTWQKAKMEKAKQQAMRVSHGGWTRFHDESGLNTAHPHDTRNGGEKPLHRPMVESIGPFPAPSISTVTTCEVGTARGLSKDIGRIGKAGRVFKKATKAEAARFNRGLGCNLKAAFSTSTKWEIVKV